MFRINNSIKLLIVLLALFLLSFAVAGQKKKSKALPQGQPVLWKQVNVSRQNLLLGPGGKEMRPDLSRITFIEKEKSGTNTKYRIKDGQGRTWVAKLGKEAQAETAAVRLVWAIGYQTEINYLVPSLTIPGKGTFTNVRLEARPDDIKRLDEWKWESNPFVGTEQLQGLKIMMAFLTNWDLKTDNNKILYDKNSRELDYVISDLGATFGKSGNLPLFWRIQRSRNNPRDYQKDHMISKTKNGRIVFTYHGKSRDLFDRITAGQSRWLMRLLAQLSDEQIRDAFRAANYSNRDVDILSREFKDRMGELDNAINQIRSGLFQRNENVGLLIEPKNAQ